MGKKVDMTKHPYRGIYAEIAASLGKSKQAVRQAAENGNPEILALVATKIRMRRAAMRRYANAIQ